MMTSWRYLVLAVGLVWVGMAAAEGDSAALKAAVRACLPTMQEGRAWQLYSGAGFVSVVLQDTRTGRTMARIQVIAHPEGTSVGESYTDRCNGWPARRVTDRWVWVLVGRVELRVSPRDVSLRSNKGLDALVEGFDLQTLVTY